MDPVSIAITVGSAIAAALYGAGASWEMSSRETALQDIGNNDPSETDCDLLCRQLRTRWNELCLALSDEAYLKQRWQQAAAAAAVAAVLVVALQSAAAAAAASVFGIFVAVALWVAAIVAAAAAVVAAGYASSALTAFNTASTRANGRRRALGEAQSQMLTSCGPERTSACRAQLLPCA